MAGLGVQLLRPLIEMTFFFRQFFFQLPQVLHRRLHSHGPFLDAPALLLAMLVFLVPLRPEAMHFLDPALEIGLGLLLAIALLGESVFLTAEVLALLFEPGAKRCQEGLLALHVGGPL